MKFSQFIEGNSLSFNNPISKEEWDTITDAELEKTAEVTFRTPSGKEVLFRKVKPGEWETVNEDWDVYECSVCQHEIVLIAGDPKDNSYNFCPNCGADMRGDTE